MDALGYRLGVAAVFLVYPAEEAATLFLALAQAQMAAQAVSASAGAL